MREAMRSSVIAMREPLAKWWAVPAVRVATIGVAYVAAVTTFGPLSWGPVALRAANVMQALAVVFPETGLALGLGAMATNAASGHTHPWWLIVLPLGWVLFGRLTWSLRARPLLGIVALSLGMGLLIALGYAMFTPAPFIPLRALNNVAAGLVGYALLVGIRAGWRRARRTPE